VPDRQRIVAIGLLTVHDLEILGSNFKRAYPVEEASFDELLRAIDEADLDAAPKKPTE
jgi:hypothetical protein